MVCGLLDVAFLSLSSNALSVLRCVDVQVVSNVVPPAPKHLHEYASPLTERLYYLAAAPVVSCGNWRVTLMRVAGGIAVVVYLLIIPGVLSYQLFLHRRNVRNDQRVAYLRFLTDPLRDGVAWFDYCRQQEVISFRSPPTSASSTNGLCSASTLSYPSP